MQEVTILSDNSPLPIHLHADKCPFERRTVAVRWRVDRHSEVEQTLQVALTFFTVDSVALPRADFRSAYGCSFYQTKCTGFSHHFLLIVVGKSEHKPMVGRRRFVRAPVNTLQFDSGQRALCKASNTRLEARVRQCVVDRQEFAQLQ